MRLIISILLLSFGVFSAKAQKTDSLQAVADSIKPLRPEHPGWVSKKDSIAQLDSIRAVKSKIESELADPFSAKSAVQQRKDSVNTKVANFKQSIEEKTGIDSLRRKVQAVNDTITKKTDVTTYTNKLTDKLNERQQRWSDSLAQKSGANRLENKTDSAYSSIESAPDRAINKAEEKLSKPDLPTDKVDTGKFTDQANVDIPLDKPTKPNVQLEDLNFDADVHQPELGGDGMSDLKNNINEEVGGLKDELPTNELDKQKAKVKEELQGVKDELQVEEVNEIKEEAADLKSELKSPKVLEDAKNSNEYQGVSENVDEVKSLSKEAGEYTTGAQKLAEGDEEYMQQFARDNSEGQLQYIAEQKQLIENQNIAYQEQVKMARELQDKELFKEKLEEELSKETVSQFTGKEETVAMAQKNLFAYKRQFKQVKSIKELEVTQANATKREGFLDRFFFGLNLEFVRSEVNSLDVVPYLGYKFMKRADVRISYSERMGIVKDDYSFENHEIRSVRGYLTYDLFKGVSVSSGYEKFTFYDQLDLLEGNSQESELLLVGIRKKYKIYKRFYGEGQFFYHWVLNGDTPYGNRVNLRIGFLIDLKR